MYFVIICILINLCFAGISHNFLIKNDPQIGKNNHKEVCPDFISECLDSETCCKMINDKYGCCPFENATCCIDKLHCCPNGYQCSGDYCFPAISGLHVETNRPTNNLQVLCPDAKSQCSDSQSCCLNINNQYACCPHENGVCCADRLHCCPQNAKCSASGLQCELPDQQDSLESSKVFLQSTSLATTTSDMRQSCADNSTATCGDEETCCGEFYMKWNCCPLPNAVCCVGGKSCCPNGYSCSWDNSQCFPNRGVHPAVNVELPTRRDSPASPTRQISPRTALNDSIVCPDGRSYCQEDKTCCRLSCGDFGCCPMSNAVCCSDGIHCCPQGSVCDIKDQKCLSSFSDGLQTSDWIESKSSVKPHPTNPQCTRKGLPTCFHGDGRESCCGFVNGVCCPGSGSTCCPMDHQCSEDGSLCIPTKLN